MANTTGPTGIITQPTPQPQPTQTAPTTRIPTTPSTSTPSASSGGQGAPPPTTLPPLNTLYPTSPDASTIDASNATASTTGAAPTANAQGATAATITNGQINPNDATNAASQLDAITKANSPYIQLAKQQGLLSAASRGLENSSIGAGASEAAAVQAAAPLAQENAGAATQAGLQTSQLETQANEFNASQQNQNQQLNAQLNTQTNQFNASQQQAAAATNAAAINSIKQQTEQIIGQMNQQFLSGTQAQQLAQIQGKWGALMSQNQTAASLMQTMLTGINSALANKDIPQARTQSSIQTNLTLLDSFMSVIDAMNGGSSAGPGTNLPKPTMPGF